MKIRSLRTNHLENPIGYQMDKPLFTWTAEDSTGTKQQAARIEVALDEAFGQTVLVNKRLGHGNHERATNFA